MRLLLPALATALRPIALLAMVSLAGCALPHRIPATPFMPSPEDEAENATPAPAPAPVMTPSTTPPTAVSVPASPAPSVATPARPPSAPPPAPAPAPSQARAPAFTATPPVTAAVTPATTARPSVASSSTHPAIPQARLAKVLPKLPQLPAAPTVNAGNRQVAVNGQPLPVLPQLPPTPGPAPALGASNPATRAQAALADLENRANLSEAQARRVAQAREALDTGNATRAATLAVPLDLHVRGATRTVTVKAGETLWHVASRTEVYGNGYLWPLIWDANRKLVTKPAQMTAGTVLHVPMYPTLDQTAAALDYSHHHGEDGRPK